MRQDGINEAVEAAAPHLTRPARVAPSVEDQRQMTARVRAVLALARSRETWDGIDIERLASDCAYAAYSWPSSQPTEAEVREQMRVTPVFEESLPNDGEYEYTSSSDCDGSNESYLRRKPRYVGSYHPWEPATREAWQNAVTRSETKEADHAKREEADRG